MRASVNAPQHLVVVRGHATNPRNGITLLDRPYGYGALQTRSGTGRGQFF